MKSLKRGMTKADSNLGKKPHAASQGRLKSHIQNAPSEEEQPTAEEKLNADGSVLMTRNLKLFFDSKEGVVKALSGVDLRIDRGEILGIVGESGCGKTVLGLSMLGLVPLPPGRYSAESEIIFQGQNILKSKGRKLELIRGTGIAMIFQEPMSSLNPVYKVGDQIAEAIKTRILRKELGRKRSISLVESVRGVRGIDENKVREEVVDTLRKVRISDPSEMCGRYPHELSGGMRQRVMIAMALAARPMLLIADEPTTALDVSIQAQILDLIKGIVKEFDMSVIFITHDLSVVAEIADRIAVMYAGRVVEESKTGSLMESPKHPYTQGLLKAQPTLGDKREQLESLNGSVPSLIKLPAGCSFHPRCPSVFSRCRVDLPVLSELDQIEKRKVACHLYTGTSVLEGKEQRKEQ
jgi:peptide/nickel transport system ATP-binding protein